jgi:hypothetical protein
MGRTENTVPLLLYLIFPWKHLFAKSLLSNDCCIFAYLAVIAQQRVYKPQYIYIYTRMEPCGTPACIISLGIDILPSTETLNFLREREELISLIRLIENFNLDNLYSKPRCHVFITANSCSLYSLGVDLIENTVYNSSILGSNKFIAMETCLSAVP